MKTQNTVFGQILALIPRDEFQQIVNKYRGDYKTHKINCWTQFVTLLYGQLRNKSSLRDIEIGLEAQNNKLYHLGIKGCPRRSTLADANQRRNPEIYESIFKMLLQKCKKQTGKNFQFRQSLTIVDSSVISLALSIYPWAKWSRIKGAVRLHAGLDYDSGLPEFAILTEGYVGEHEVARALPIRSDSITLTVIMFVLIYK